MIERFRHAVHKVIVLNRRNNAKQFKLFELFDQVKEKKNVIQKKIENQVLPSIQANYLNIDTPKDLLLDPLMMTSPRLLAPPRPRNSS